MRRGADREAQNIRQHFIFARAPKAVAGPHLGDEPVGVGVLDVFGRIDLFDQQVDGYLRQEVVEFRRGAFAGRAAEIEEPGQIGARHRGPGVYFAAQHLRALHVNRDTHGTTVLISALGI